MRDLKGTVKHCPMAYGDDMTTQCRREAFSATYRSCYSAVLSYIRRRTDGDNAEDLTAEVFTRAWNRWDSREGAELPWIYGIARHVVLEHYRVRDKNAAIEKAVQETSTEAATPMQEVDARFTICAALERLNLSDREILALHAWENLEPAEIAQVLGISANSARVRLHRARHRLANLLYSTSGSSRGECS